MTLYDILLMKGTEMTDINTLQGAPTLTQRTIFEIRPPGRNLLASQSERWAGRSRHT